MIPVKLTLRNFMPYRDNVPPLNFAGIHTASIWGENGAGKSSIMDAMTWALWGETRAKSGDDIIHQGQNETAVEFDFLVGQQPYRVIRKHTRPKRQRGSGQSSLDLLIANNGDFKVISGNTIRATEQQIRDILHMDYDTFVNSAYLRQGHADEFTIASPAKRKDVLGDILGLSLYDELANKAREMTRVQERNKALAESAIGEIRNELSRKPAYEDELAKAQSELSQIEMEITAAENRLNDLRQKKEFLESKQQQLTQLERHIAETARTLARWNEQTKQYQERIKQYEELLVKRSAIEEGYARFSETKKASDEMDQKLRLATALSERKHKIEIVIMQASQALLKEHALTESKMSELHAKANKLTQLKTDLQQAQMALDRLAEEDESLRQKRQSEQKLTTAIHSLETDKTRLETEITGINEKLTLLAAQTGAVCPLCERELGEDHRRLIEEKYGTEKREKSATLATEQRELIQRQAELNAIITEIPRLEIRLNQAKASAQSRVSLLGREIDEAGHANRQADEERERLKEIEERQARKDYAIAEQRVLRQIDDELAKLDYDAQRHEQARQTLIGLEQWENARRRLEEADRSITREKEEFTKAEQAAQEANQSLEIYHQTRQTLAAELVALPQAAADLARAEAEQRGLAARQKQAQETTGGIKNTLQRLSELEARLKERESSLAQASKEEVIYRDLAQAFGKNGIQAWLIEMALPEIEVEANKLLGRMTDNRMHVTIETQRQTKAGDTAETLDIKIADELGTRNYEMFSGGEAFRINFAIRIALSKLLARRAGAPLPTLIIDEGFGTQDTGGLEKLKEAIISIQDDFKMILVITHVEEMRDAFPTRIDVTKTAQGSTVEVS